MPLPNLNWLLGGWQSPKGPVRFIKEKKSGGVHMLFSGSSWAVRWTYTKVKQNGGALVLVHEPSNRKLHKIDLLGTILYKRESTEIVLWTKNGTCWTKIDRNEPARRVEVSRRKDLKIPRGGGSKASCTNVLCGTKPEPCPKPTQGPQWKAPSNPLRNTCFICGGAFSAAEAGVVECDHIVPYGFMATYAGGTEYARPPGAWHESDDEDDKINLSVKDNKKKIRALEFGWAHRECNSAKKDALWITRPRNAHLHGEFKPNHSAVHETLEKIFVSCPTEALKRRRGKIQSRNNFSEKELLRYQTTQHRRIIQRLTEICNLLNKMPLEMFKSAKKHTLSFAERRGVSAKRKNLIRKAASIHTRKKMPAALAHIDNPLPLSCGSNPPPQDFLDLLP